MEGVAALNALLDHEQVPQKRVVRDHHAQKSDTPRHTPEFPVVSSWPGFWLRSIWHALTFPPVILGATIVALPLPLAILLRHYPELSAIPWLHWIAENPKESHLAFGLCALGLYLLYAPYRLYRHTTSALQHRVADLQSHLIAESEKRVSIVLEDVMEILHHRDGEAPVAALYEAGATDLSAHELNTLCAELKLRHLEHPFSEVAGGPDHWLWLLHDAASRGVCLATAEDVLQYEAQYRRS